MPELELRPSAWEFVRIYSMGFDSNPDTGTMRLIWDTDIPIDRWINEDTHEYNFSVCQSHLEFGSVHGIRANMDNGSFDPCELVISEAEILERVERRGAIGLTQWNLVGDWFEISVVARSLRSTPYMDAVVSERPAFPGAVE